MTPIGPQCQLGECPLWDPRLNQLYLIDIDGRAIHRLNLDEESTETRMLPGRPGSMVLTADPGRIVVALEHELVEMAWVSGDLNPLVKLEAEGSATRLNDGRCDSRGRYWVGSMDDPHDALERRGSLYSVTVDGQIKGADDLQFVVSKHRSDVCVSNGMAFSPDGLVMYWADSPRRTVWRYDIDPDSGERYGERVFLDFDQGLPGAPDGACVDESGCYWVACVTGGAVLRATPDGQVDKVIDVPVNLPTMPAFGGPDLDTMFLTSIADDGPGQAGGGVTLALDLGVRGIAEPFFAA